MPPIRLFLLVAALVVSSPSPAAEPEPADALADYAVLTPAMEGRYHVASGVDLTTMINPFFSIASIADRGNTKDLRSLVEREGYDAPARLAERLAQALTRAGFSAVQEPVTRRPAGTVQSLTWSDVPEAPRGKVMLDVTIRWICLCSELAFSKLYPAVSIGWRLLGPHELLEPTRNFLHFHHPMVQKPKKTPAGKPPPDPATLPPIALVTESCGRSGNAVDENPEALWTCLDEALAAASDRLAFELKKAASRSGSPTA